MATTHTVQIVHDDDVEDGQARYVPDSITITAGDSIVWENQAHMDHTASRHVEPGKFSTGFLAAGTSSAPQLIDDVSDEAGFEYACDIHPGMVGKVIVNAQVAAPHEVEIVHDDDVEDGQARYVPDPITITAGESIIWINRAHMEHTASRHVEPGKFDTGFLLADATSAPQQINEASGDAGFEYGCDIHPGMRGTVIVLPREDNSSGDGSEPVDDTVDNNVTAKPAA